MKACPVRSIKRVFLTILFPLLFLSSIAGSARAEYPERAIRSIVPFGPGGASDILARIYADRLNKMLKQPVYIENKPGAGGNIGILAALAAKPDGYTILFSSIATTQNPALYKKAPYDPADLIPVAQLGEAQFLIAVNTSRFPVKDMTEFVAAIKAAPGKYNAAAGGIGTKLAEEVFKLQNGLDFTTVMYGGAGQAATSLLKDETDFIIVDAAPLSAVLGTDKVKSLAVTGEKRLPAYPDVPTTREAGFGDYQESSHFGIYVRKGTPDSIVRQLHDAANEINQDAAMVERLQTLGWTPTIKSMSDFERFYLADIARWKEIVQKANVPTLD
jgi:tripartite-type tricarboxylate transporter receptor subunit TctC